MSNKNMELARYPGSGDDDRDPSKCVRVLITGGGGGGLGSQELSVEVARSTQISKIKQCYCNRYGLSVKGLKFFHDGNRLNNDSDSKTLQELEAEEGTYYIDVFQNQDGGGHPSDRVFWF